MLTLWKQLFPSTSGGSRRVHKHTVFKISRDNRHKNVITLCDEKIDERLFLSWSMKLAPFENMEWSNEDLNSGNFLNITSEEALNVFIRLNEFTRR